MAHTNPIHPPTPPTPHTRSTHLLHLLASTLAILSLSACASTSPSSDAGPLSPRDTRGLEQAERSVQVSRAADTARTPTSGYTNAPAAVLAGETYSLAQLAPFLAESAGAVIIEELLLTALAERELTRAGMALTPADIEAERAELARALQAGNVPGDPSEVIAAVRRTRGLGDNRFDLLLRRTAALRKLVASEVGVTEQEVALAHRIRYGPRYRTRLIMIPTERDAAQIIAELRPLDPATRRARFIQLAVDRSIDNSSSAGGLLEPISTADPSYPATVRSALSTLQPGDMSPVLAMNPNYAIVLVEEITPDQGVSLQSVAPTLRDDIRRRQERLAMDRKAQVLIESSAPTVLDPSLQWSWRTREARRQP